MSTANDRCIQRAYRSETDTSTDRELWVVSVPAVDYIRQAFFGAIANLGFPESYNPISDVAAEYGSEIVESLTQIVPPEVITTPGNTDLILFPPTANVIIGNALLFTGNISQRFGNYYNQNTPANNDTYRWTRFISQGDWAYRVTGVRFNSAGILNLLVSNIGLTVNYLNDNHDFYNAATTFNYAVTGTFNLPEAREVAISIHAAGKNGSSSNYGLYVSSVEMWRTN